MTHEHDAVRDLLAPVAVSAASPSEITRVEAHVVECPICREDLARLREGGDALALAAPAVDPPARLKRRLMATVREEAAARAPEPARERRLPAWLGGLRPWPAGAAAAVAVAILLLGWNIALQTDDPASDAEVASLSVSGEGGVKGRVLYLPDEDQAIVSLTRLPVAGEGRGYQLWVIRDGAPASAGFLSTVGPADAVAVASQVRGADALAVTLERRTNRVRPTTPPIVAVDLPQRA